jgi:hypothetical protein
MDMARQPLTVEDLRTIAIACRELKADAEMTPELLDYTRTILGHYASIADDTKSGEAIRVRFGLPPAG